MMTEQLFCKDVCFLQSARTTFCCTSVSELWAIFLFIEFFSFRSSFDCVLFVPFRFWSYDILGSDWLLHLFFWGRSLFDCPAFEPSIGQVASCTSVRSDTSSDPKKAWCFTDTADSAMGQTQKRVTKKRQQNAQTHSEPPASHVLVFQPRDGWCCELFPFFWIEQRPAMIQIQKLNFRFSQSDVLRLTLWSPCCDCCFGWVSVPKSDQSWEAIKKTLNTFPH